MNINGMKMQARKCGTNFKPWFELKRNAKMCCALLYLIYIILCWSVLIISSLL